jgi:hypothetical protein
MCEASKAKEITMGMLIIPLTLIAGIAGLFIGAYLQSKLSRKPVVQKRSVNVYLLPERRERQ